MATTSPEPPVPDFFIGLSSLQSIYLDDNSFDPWFILANLKNVTTLNFSANSANVSDNFSQFLTIAFASLDHLAFNLFIGTLPATFTATPLLSLWLNNQVSSSYLSGGIAFLTNMTTRRSVASVQ